VFKESLAVVGQQDHRRVLRQTPRLEAAHERAKTLVEVLDLAIVQALELPQRSGVIFRRPPTMAVRMTPSGRLPMASSKGPS